MKNLSFGSILALVREVGRAFISVASGIVGAIMRMPLPRLLLVCVVAALIFTILPLAITLFIVAIIVKLIGGALVQFSRQDALRLEHSVDAHGER